MGAAKATSQDEPLAARGGRAMLRVGERPGALWTSLWVAGAAGTVGALWPVLVGGDDPVSVADVIFRVTGGSFVAAGLVAWQRRPANRVGALMVATGFLFFVAPLAAQVDSIARPDAGAAVYGLLDDRVRRPAPRLSAQPRPARPAGAARVCRIRDPTRRRAARCGCSSSTTRSSSTTSVSGRTSARQTGSTRASEGCCSPQRSRSSSSSRGGGGKRARRCVACSCPCSRAARRCSRSVRCSRST